MTSRQDFSFSPRGAIAGILLLAAGLALCQVLEHRISRVQSADALIEDLPYQFGQWQGQDLPALNIESREVLKLDRFVKRVYRDSSGRSVGLYIGYWQAQSGDYQAAKHSPTLCLPANGWRIERPQEVALSLDSRKQPQSMISVSRLRGEVDGQKSLFYYWFFSGDKFYTRESESLLRIILSKLLSGRSDGGIVEVYTRIGPGETGHAEKKAEQALNDFLASFLPELNKVINHS